MGLNSLNWLLIGFYGKKKRKFMFVQKAMDSDGNQEKKLIAHLKECSLNLV